MANQHKLEHIPVELLDLDLENPRLPHDIPREEISIISYLATETSLEDLMSSIVTNGFFSGEPLVAYPSPHNKDRLIIVEGNRRLSAVKLIHNPELLPGMSARMQGLVDSVGDRKPEKLPVIIMQSREEVLPYLGFRHITGIKAWSPLQKARYVEQLLHHATHPDDSPQDRYKVIADTIGSKSHVVRKLLDALAFFNLSEEKNFFGIENLNEHTLSFGVLYTALSDEELQSFTGISKGDEFTHPILNPAVLKVENISELLKWMFEKNERGETVLGESRNITKLATVVACDSALERLRNGALLEVAYSHTAGHLEEIRKDLTDANNLLSHAASIIANAPYDEGLLELAREIREQISLIGQAIKEKATHEDEF